MSVDMVPADTAAADMVAVGTAAVLAVAETAADPDCTCCCYPCLSLHL